MKTKFTHFSGMVLAVALLSLSLSVAAKPPAKAKQAKPSAHRSQDESKAKKNELAKHLETMHVRGDRIKAAIAQLRLIKAALNRPLSMNLADADKLIYRIRLKTGSHLHHFLLCASNRQRIKQRDRLRTQIEASHWRSFRATSIGDSTAYRAEIDKAKLMRLLNELPPANTASEHR